MGELLTDAHRLKIHAEDRRHADGVLSRAIETSDLVEDGLDLEHVVPLDAAIAGRGVLPGNRIVGVDFRRIQVVYSRSGWAVQNLIGRMLVGPGGAPAVGADDLED